MATNNSRTLVVDDITYSYTPIPADVARLPYSIRVLLESALRNCDGFEVTEQHIQSILQWETTSRAQIEIPFKPARVLLQDFTGVPCVVDLAAMRDAMRRLGGDPAKINPLVPVDLVIDHSVQVDAAGTADAIEVNQRLEFQRNEERFRFLKWGATAFENMLIVPPGSGIVHQVNLEYLARVVFCNVTNTLYPDSLIGTDSHTTMVNGLGVTGWGVGGIEAEAVMLGQSVSMVLPEVVGYRLTGQLPVGATSTDLVLTITQNLRAFGVVGKFVEFFGPGVQQLSLADRATLSNMAPEYGATMGYFPVDDVSLAYMAQTGRDAHVIKRTEAYLRAQGLFVDHSAPAASAPNYSAVLELDLATIVPCLAGPKRPQDRVALTALKTEFSNGLTARVGPRSFGIPAEKVSTVAPLELGRQQLELRHGAVVIAAITSCTNTSNPSVMIGAGLIARNAVRLGLAVPRFVKASLSPGSGVVTRYLREAGLQSALDQLGFTLAGYGCMTCIGNSGELADEVSAAINSGDLVVAAVLSGNRNFEGRVHPLSRANYLASPMLVVAYALAGTVNINLDTDPIGMGTNGPVMLRDLWPSKDEISDLERRFVRAEMFREVYGAIQHGTPMWNALTTPAGFLYPWDEHSTYIHNPPFFQSMVLEAPGLQNVARARCLLNLGDSITTDHISPAGNIAKSCPAQRYLAQHNVRYADFNTYGARRGNDEVMARGTFANIRLVNKMMSAPGAQTVYVPSGETMDIFDAAMRYQTEHIPLVILAGAEYGSGSSRDWAAKGPYLLGVKAVIAVSFERIHRSNLVGMGILPLQFKDGQNADTLGLTGREEFTIDLTSLALTPSMDISVTVQSAGAEPRTIATTSRLDTAVELDYFRHGGILPYVLRKLVRSGASK